MIMLISLFTAGSAPLMAISAVNVTVSPAPAPPIQLDRVAKSPASQLAASAPGAAMASTQARAGGNGAEVVRDDGDCFVADNTGSWVFSCKIQFVIQADGTINHHITGSVIPEESSPLPLHPVKDFAGQPCFVLDGVVLTRVTAGIVTPSGQVKLTCRS